MNHKIIKANLNKNNINFNQINNHNRIINKNKNK